jgi:hypothetical protein
MNTFPACIALFALAASGTAQAPRPGVTQDWAKVEQRIAWHGTWDAATAAAKATGRPILLVFAAPHCSQVPGMW